ncbi:MAG: NAD(P)H-hydrate dehydratase, partial [Verrucomicrobiae bacterium]|nr:NAD(P)H-hydrate dehydratase [Verrucomicrobiae bacterium]
MPVPVLSITQMREWERATWATGKTEQEVIRRVGQLVAKRALALTEPGDSILILAGKGHNGDDARCAREHLTGRQVDLIEVTDPQRPETIEAVSKNLRRRPALLIDGLFGIGLNRPLDPHWQEVINRINEAGVRVLAVDVPSGLNADTGEPHGAAIHAAITLTLGAPKRGLIEPAAWQFVGRLEVAPEIGLVQCPFTAQLYWTLAEDFVGFPPRRAAGTHKGTYGHLAIIAGSLGYHGAAVLAARGAQRAQPGLITVYTHEMVYHAIAAQLQSAMVRVLPFDLKQLDNYTAVLIGPGLAAPEVASELAPLARRLWRDAPVPVIVDATALDWLRTEAIAGNGVRVVTPHPGEAARMLKTVPQKILANRVEALQRISEQYGRCWVVLKGYQTLVGKFDTPLYINSSGNPHLAQGGSGDLLAGYLAGLLAQPALREDVLKTIRYAVWQHGA